MGVVILGKSSMSELAFGLHDTQNSVIEQYTRNPHRPKAHAPRSGPTTVRLIQAMWRTLPGVASVASPSRIMPRPATSTCLMPAGASSGLS